VVAPTILWLRRSMRIKLATYLLLKISSPRRHRIAVELRKQCFQVFTWLLTEAPPLDSNGATVGNIESSVQDLFCPTSRYLKSTPFSDIHPGCGARRYFQDFRTQPQGVEYSMSVESPMRTDEHYRRGPHPWLSKWTWLDLRTLGYRADLVAPQYRETVGYAGQAAMPCRWC
jgi:hypothetical protein